MTRNGNYDIAPTSIEIDKLNYTYDSYNPNRLIKVTDLTNSPLGFSDGANNANEYDYDGHGNMIRDDNKGITGILYNHLNLPTQITFSGTTTRKIQYLYNAAGSKQKKVVTDGTVITTTDYLSGFQYQNNVLEFFPHAEGYVKHTEGYYNYIFNYTDHLGNVRLSYAQNPNGFATRILEENHYYPFRLKHTNYDNETQRFMRGIGDGDDIPIFIAPDIFGSGSYKYKYKGKELQDELGLNMYDYGAGNYDPAIGRWMNIDPLAEKSRRFSPYVYVLNNPVFFIDPDGMQAIANEGDDWVNWTSSTGQQHLTYDPEIKTMDEANAKYKNVEEVFESGTGRNESTGEAIAFEANGNFSVNGGESLNSADGYTTEGGSYINKSLTGREQILKVTEALQDYGDTTAVVGYAATATVVGAEVGIPTALVGNIVSGIGSAGSIGTNLFSGHFKEALKGAAFMAAGGVMSRQIDKASTMTALGTEILQQNVSLKLMGIERLTEK